VLDGMRLSRGDEISCVVGASRSRWLLPSLGAALLALLAILVMVYVRPPAGWSPRLGAERDVTSFFPAFWRVLPAAASPGAFRLSTSALLLALWATYAAALRTVRGARDPWTVGAVVVIAHLALVMAPPVVCNDVYRYAVFGRMVRGGLNPYLAPPLVLSGDPLLPYANWWNVTSNYGPSFTWLSAALAWLGGDGVFATGVAFKAAAAVASVACCWLIGRLAAALGGDGLWAAAAWGWNPLVLLESAAMGHNEAIMMALALLGLLLVARGRVWPGFAVLVVSADIKQVTGAAALLVAVWFVARGEDWRQRLARAGGLAARTHPRTHRHGRPVWGGREVLGAGRQILFQGPTLVAGASALNGVVAVVFAALVIAAAALAARAPLERVIELAAGLIFVFIVFVYPWRFPWYSLAPLALFAVTARGRPRLMLFGVVVVWGATLMLQYTMPHPIG
jgi:hypothetical protein